MGRKPNCSRMRPWCRTRDCAERRHGQITGWGGTILAKQTKLLPLTPFSFKREGGWGIELDSSDHGKQKTSHYRRPHKQCVCPRTEVLSRARPERISKPGQDSD